MQINLTKIAMDFLSIARKERTDKRPYRYFVSPCQITVLFVKEKKLLFMILKHDTDVADKQVVEHLLDDGKAMKKLLEQTILTDPYWKKQSTLLEIAYQLGVISVSIDMDKSSTFGEKIRFYDIHSKKSLSKNDGFMVCQVDSETITADDLHKILGKQEEKFESERPYLMEEYMGEYEYLNFVFWYPPFVFEDFPITLDEKLLFEVKYKGYRLFFTNFSQIGILIPIKPPLKDFAKKSLECLNEIIGIANIFGIDGVMATEDALQTMVFTRDLKKRIGQGASTKPSIPRYLLEKIRQNPVALYGLDLSVPFSWHTKDIFIDLIAKTEKITKNKELKNFVGLFLDAKTHFLQEQLKTSFLLSWIVLEKYIDDLWAEYLVGRNTSKKRFKKLTESMLWTADDKLETLNLLGEISEERYSQIVRLKRIRNAIVHEERSVVLGEAKECNDLARNIVREIIRKKSFVE